MQIIFLSVFIIIVTLLPISLQMNGVPWYFCPQIDIGIAYYFALKSERVGALFWFLYGIFIDIAYNHILGTTSLILLITYNIIYYLAPKIRKQSSLHVILYLGIVVCCINIIGIILKDIAWSYSLVLKVLAKICSTIFIYPLLYRIIDTKFPSIE